MAGAILLAAAGCSTELPSTPPSSSATSSPATLPDLPSEIDPAQILWVGDLASGTSSMGYQGGVWKGTLVGATDRLSEVGGDSGSVADGNLFFYGSTHPDNGYVRALWIVEPGEDARILGYGGPGYAVAARFAVVERVDMSGDSSGLWALPFGQAQPRLLIRPGPTVRTAHAVPDDGMLVASGGCPDHMTPGNGIDLLRDGKVENLGFGDPVGFDFEGGLVVREFCAPNGRLLRLGEDGVTELVKEANQARVTRDGRHLIALDQGKMMLYVTDLATLASFSLALPGDSWSLTQLGDNEFAVLEGYFPDEKAWRPLVVSLGEGWLGLLPTLARPSGIP